MTKLPFEEKRPSGSPRAKSNRLRRVFVIIGALLLLGLVWRLTHRPGSAKKAPPIPLPVAARPVTAGDINIYLDSLGTVAPLSTITLKTQISGQLTKINFNEGQMVNRGDLLAVIDPRPYQVALEQSEGQLRQAQAQLAEAKIDLARYEKLSGQESIALQQVDTQRALVEQYSGGVQIDEAAVASAKLNLAYCHITAPIAGRVGLRSVDEGNYVTPGDAGGLATLTQVKPITVIFTLPEQSLPQVAARLRAGAKLEVDAYDQSQAHKLASGTLTAIDNQVDPTTGTFRLRATFPNDDEGLYPLQFVNVKMLLDVARHTPVIPTSAIERNQQGAFVYVVKPNNTVTARMVTLGATEGERVAVSGVKLGERVVVDGADRLREGQQVTLPASDAKQ